MELAGQLVIGKRFALLFGAMFILVVAILLHVEYLYYISLALAATPGVAYLWGRWSLNGIVASRRMPEVVTAGESSAMSVAITNRGATRRSMLVIKDNLPSGLSAESTTERFLSDILPAETAEVSYPFLARRRGVYHLGWVDLSTTDPLGIFAYHKELEALGTLVVHPRPVPLPPIKPPSAGMMVASRARARKRGEGTDLYGVREYTPGDDLRRIDWKSTAKRGKLTVVEYESGEATNLAVALDLSPGFHAGAEDESTIEYGVTLAASIASQCLRRGTEFSLIAEGQASHSLRLLMSPESETAAMDALARVRADCPDPFADTLVRFEEWLPPGAGIVVISPAVGPEAVNAARRLTALGHGVLWVSLVAASFAPSGAAEAAYAELAVRLAGARCDVRQIRSGDDVATRMGVRAGAA
jgi:uncharacterized protein (DUF58 family)